MPLQEDGRLVLAGWARFGSIVGPETDEIPATKRLYGGGAGSVRAYGYEELGPIGADGDPTGGRSKVEVGTELRWRMFEDVGGVAFVEGGNVYDNTLPEFDEPILWGAGVGIRYYTDFGPLRFDIAFPINPAAYRRPLPVLCRHRAGILMASDLAQLTVMWRATRGSARRGRRVPLGGHAAVAADGAGEALDRRHAFGGTVGCNGYSVSVGSIEGRLPFTASALDVVMADAQGEWLRLRRLDLAW